MELLTVSFMRIIGPFCSTPTENWLFFFCSCSSEAFYWENKLSRIVKLDITSENFFCDARILLKY